ncbi:hypothetical protein BU17DRAFT_61148 [Hysterangium stoloniferum]|nr:hypothetical protein BU17DRAFT_61148 [Hysterangium stoloniferum]
MVKAMAHNIGPWANVAILLLYAVKILAKGTFFVTKKLFSSSLPLAPVADVSSSSKLMALFKIVIEGKIDPYYANVIVYLLPVNVSSQLVLRPAIAKVTPLIVVFLHRHVWNVCHQALCVVARAAGMMLFWLLNITVTIGYKLLKSVLGCICTVSARRSYSLADDLMSSPLLVPVLMIRNPITVRRARIQATVNSADTLKGSQPVAPADTHLLENIHEDNNDVFNYEEMSRHMSASSCGSIDVQPPRLEAGWRPAGTIQNDTRVLPGTGQSGERRPCIDVTTTLELLTDRLQIRRRS